MFRRFFIFLFLFTVHSSLFSAPTLAADNLLKDKLDAINQGGNQESWLSSSLETNIVLGIKSIVGDIEFNNDGSLKTGWLPGGLIGTANNFIGSLYQPPASGINYIAQSFQSFLGKPAYAQGIGFSGLQPLIMIWRSFRNAVYLLSSIIFVVIGMMIMLRVKVSPQAVITIQNAIPNLITTLILVTFSYAIAGLLIDASYVVQAAGTALIFPGTVISSSILNTLNKIPVIASFIPNIDPLNPNITVLSGFLILPALTTVLLSVVIAIIFVGIMAAPFGITPYGSFVAQATSILPTVTWSTIAGILTLFLLAILILIWLFKFTMGLFKCYATLIFKIVLAPLEIGLGAFPNMKIGFSTWITDVIANLSVFVFSYLFLVLSNYIILTILVGDATSTVSNVITGLTSGTLPDIGLWVPNILQTGGLPIPGAWLAVGAIGLSTLLLLSKLPDMIPQFIFMIKPSPWGQAIGQGLAEVDPRKNFLYKEGSMFARQQFLGPTLEQAGQRLGGSNNQLVQRLGNKLEDYGLTTQGRKPVENR